MNHLIFEKRLQHKRQVQKKNQRSKTEPGGNRGDFSNKREL